MKKLDWNIWSKNPKDHCNKELHDNEGNKIVIDNTGSNYRIFVNDKFNCACFDIDSLVYFLNANDVY